MSAYRIKIFKCILCNLFGLCIVHLRHHNFYRMHVINFLSIKSESFLVRSFVAREHQKDEQLAIFFLLLYVAEYNKLETRRMYPGHYIADIL